MSDAIDIGGGVSVRWDDDGTGFVWKHPKCRAWSSLKLAPHPQSTGHRATSGGMHDMANFTIEGSLLCPGGCGTHGFIENGRWRGDP